MIVYRVEKNGEGPYRCNDEKGLLQDMYDEHNWGKKHPVPYFDCEKDMEEGEVCGFASLDLLSQWFKGHTKALNKSSFKVHVYEAEPTAEGTYQLLFKDKESRLIKTLRLR